MYRDNSVGIETVYG